MIHREEVDSLLQELGEAKLKHRYREKIEAIEGQLNRLSSAAGDYAMVLKKHQRGSRQEFALQQELQATKELLA